MKIVYLHYHLKPGGVTTVLHRQVQSLPVGTTALVLSGEAPSTAFPAPVVTIPGIGYDGTPGTAQPAIEIAKTIDQAVVRHFGGRDQCDLLHIHNPTLAKNGKFLDIMRHLQRMGYPLLLQIHDFAEDGRPTLYYRDADYPANCHYSVINRRDYRLLEASGLDPAGLHYLPNSIPTVESIAPDGDDANYVLFPVRAIRRKNIGEALLLSLFLPAACQIYITLPPNSPADFPSYRLWRQLANDRRLPVRFDMGLRKDFRTLLHQARHVLSTSISEGFGFAFLEPWVAGKSMEGRILPAICRDFSEAGVRLDHLYAQFHIPVSWIGRNRLIARFQSCYRHNCRLFGQTSQMPSAQSFSASLQKAETIDFGMLDEPLQALVITSVHSEKARQNRLQALNPALRRMGSKPRSARRIQNNRECILHTYGRSASSLRLEKIYQKVVRRPVCHQIDKRKLIKKFINFHNFSLLKWNPYREAL